MESKTSPLWVRSAAAERWYFSAGCSEFFAQKIAQKLPVFFEDFFGKIFRTFAYGIGIDALGAELGQALGQREDSASGSSGQETGSARGSEGGLEVGTISLLGADASSQALHQSQAATATFDPKPEAQINQSASRPWMLG